MSAETTNVLLPGHVGMILGPNGEVRVILAHEDSSVSLLHNAIIQAAIRCVCDDDFAAEQIAFGEQRAKRAN